MAGMGATETFMNYLDRLYEAEGGTEGDCASRPLDIIWRSIVCGKNGRLILLKLLITLTENYRFRIPLMLRR